MLPDTYEMRCLLVYGVVGRDKLLSLREHRSHSTKYELSKRSSVYTIRTINTLTKYNEDLNEV